MAEPTPDPAPQNPEAQATPRAARRGERLAQIGLEAVSLSMLAFVATGLLVYSGRREISRELAQAWLAERGIDAVVEVDDLDASGFSGSIRLGPKSDPIFAADRIEVAYDLQAPWSGGPFAIDTRAVRLVRPRLKASLTDKGLNFGALQPLIDEAMASPGDPRAIGPTILVENARLDLRTPGGLARITGDASLDEGKLLRFDGRLARMRYDTADLVVEARGALVSARKRGDRLAVVARFDLAALVGQGLELEDAQGEIDAEIAYPDLAKLAAPGPAQLRLALKAAGFRLGDSRATDAAAAFTLAGRLDGALSQARFDGHLSGRATGEGLEAPGLKARGLGLDLDLPRLTAALQDDRLALSAGGQVSASLDQALAGGAALRDVSGRVESAGLILSTDSAGGSVSGPLSIQLGAGRLASGALALTSLAAKAQGRVSGPMARPALTLDGSAAADSGIAQPDAERLAAVLPNPAYARAASQALQGFDLRVPALRLALREGRTVLTLPEPLTLSAANGVMAKVAAPGGLLADLSADGLARGGLTTSLSGGGLPALRLDAPEWRMAGGVLTSRLAVAGEAIDLPPLEGLKGRIEGVATASASGARFVLSGCAPLTARRVLVGETPLSGQSLSLCPGPAALFASGAEGWSASARFRDLSSGLDEAQARIAGVSGLLTAGGAGGLDRAQLTLEQGTLTDAAETRRFNPVKTSGRLALSGGIWSGTLDAATPVGQPLGRIVLRHDVARARGRAEIDASKLVFAKDGGLQPADLSPMAAFAKNASGPAGFTGVFVWDADGMTSKGRLVADRIDFTSPIGFVATLDGTIDFTSLTPLVSAPDQSLKITRIDSIVPLQAFAALFNLGADSLHISSAAFEAAKGRISIEPTDVSFDPEKPIRGVIVVEHLDLGELIAASSLVEKIQLEAVIDGRLPFELSPRGFRFLDGKVRAIQPGRLAISRAALTGVQAGVQGADSDSPGAPAPAAGPQAPVNAIQDFAYQAMENLSFDTLEAGVNSTDQGRLAILFHIKGEHDPKVAEKARIGLLDLIRGTAFNKRIALPAKTPVDLTLDTSLNFDELLAAWRNAYKAQSEVDARSAPVQP